MMNYCIILYKLAFIPSISVTKMRQYQKTHPWLKFELNLKHFPYHLWTALGEAQSKCEHIAGVPLSPEVAQKLHNIYLAKGTLATAAIEGNTLSEEEALDRVEGKKELPPSKEYLGQELDNIIEACNNIATRLFNDGDCQLDVEKIKEFNFQILKKLPLKEEVIPGEIRQHDVGVGTYKAVPYHDCAFLLNEYCHFLNTQFQTPNGMKIVFGIIKAILAHVYFALIHPFADGNGRTARLIELKILLSVGVPMPAAQLLNNHYNQTRTEYYRQLDIISKRDGDLIGFIEYATQGYIDGIKDQLQIIRKYQFDVAWVNYIHELFKDKDNQPSRRKRNLVLDLPREGEVISIHKIKEVSPRVAESYAGKDFRTILRDISDLSTMKLIERTKGGIRPRTELITAFLPRRWEE